jgi:hypothetical protein
MLTEFGPHVGETTNSSRDIMLSFAMRVAAAAFGGILLLASTVGSFAQAVDPKPEKPPTGEVKDGPKKVDEFVEAEQSLTGSAANRECVWLGQRVVNLLWRDDLDTAFRHLELYDRFGCPSDHVQASFRCLLRQGDLDPKASDKLNARVHACWINPTGEVKGTAAAPSGSTSR